MSSAAHDVDLWRAAVAIVVHFSRGHGREADELIEQAVDDGDAGDLIATLAWLSLGLSETASKLTGRPLEDLLLRQAAALRSSR